MNIKRSYIKNEDLIKFDCVFEFKKNYLFQFKNCNSNINFQFYLKKDFESFWDLILIENLKKYFIISSVNNI
jgi:hypothetical protein